MEALYVQWFNKAPKFRYKKMIMEISSNHRSVTCDSRLQVIFERSILYWTRTLGRAINLTEGENPKIQMFRLTTMLQTIARTCGHSSYEIFVLHKFTTFLMCLQAGVRSQAGQDPSLGPFQMGTSQFVNDELFMGAFSTFLACKDHPPEFSDMVDCSYDVAVDAFSWPTSS